MMCVNLTSMSLACADCSRCLVTFARSKRLHQGGPDVVIRFLQELSAVCAVPGMIKPLVSSVHSLWKKSAHTFMWFRMLHQSFRWDSTTVANKGWTEVRGVFTAYNFGSGGSDNFLEISLLRSLKTRFAQIESLKLHRRVSQKKHMYQALEIFKS